MLTSTHAALGTDRCGVGCAELAGDTEGGTRGYSRVLTGLRGAGGREVAAEDGVGTRGYSRVLAVPPGCWCAMAAAARPRGRA
jgi:hypothetical protein